MHFAVNKCQDEGQDELKKLQRDHAKILQTLTMKLSSVDLYIY